MVWEMNRQMPELLFHILRLRLALDRTRARIEADGRGIGVPLVLARGLWR